MIRRPPRSTPLYSSAASDVYKRQAQKPVVNKKPMEKQHPRQITGSETPNNNAAAPSFKKKFRLAKSGYSTSPKVVTSSGTSTTSATAQLRFISLISTLTESLIFVFGTKTTSPLMRAMPSPCRAVSSIFTSYFRQLSLGSLWTIRFRNFQNYYCYCHCRNYSYSICTRFTSFSYCITICVEHI